MHAKEIWLVKGYTGEYSDARDWTVFGYTTEAEANKHRDAAQAAVLGSEEWDYEKRSRFKNPHDPQCTIDYTGATYRVEMVEVRERFEG